MKILGCRKNDKTVGLRNITWILKKGLGVNDKVIYFEEYVVELLESFCFTHIIKSFVSFASMNQFIIRSPHYLSKRITVINDEIQKEIN